MSALQEMGGLQAALMSRGTVANPYGLPNVQVSRVRRSESTAKLDEALAKAILGFGEVLKENENPFFKSKYADLSAVLAATRKQLAQHGISLRQWPYTEDGKVGITSRLCCQGEWEESECSIPLTGKQDAQAVGSALTYIRRYATQSILCVAAESDDDANAAVVQKTKAAEKRFEDARISPVNVREFWKEARKTGHSNDQVAAYLAELGYKQTEEIKQSEYDGAVEWARKPVSVTEDILGALNESLDMARAKKAATAPSKAPSDPFWKSFWVTAKKHNVSEADIHTYAREQFGMKESLKELNPADLGKLVGWVTSVQP